MSNVALILKDSVVVSANDDVDGDELMIMILTTTLMMTLMMSLYRHQC